MIEVKDVGTSDIGMLKSMHIHLIYNKCLISIVNNSVQWVVSLLNVIIQLYEPYALQFTSWTVLGIGLE